MSAIKPTSIDQSFIDLDLNLRDMETALKAGKEIDIGFIQILSNDLEELRKAKYDMSKVTQASQRLSQSANRIYEIAENEFLKPANPDQARPLVGKEQAMSELVKEYKHSPGDVKKGLEILSSAFTMKPIAGDSHCLFRSVAVGTLDYLTNASPQEKRTFFATLKQSVDDLQALDPKLLDQYSQVNKLIEEIAKKKKTLENVTKSAQTSDLLVEFLRRLSTAYNQKHGDEVFNSEAGLYPGGKEKYLADMRDMQKKLYGGQPELYALEKTLGFTYLAIDVAEVGKGTMKAETYVKEAQNDPKTVCLLRRPIHYDVAYLISA
jgi:hypothetical protein